MRAKRGGEGPPVVFQRFHDVREMAEAATYGQNGVSLALPGPPVSTAGAPVLVCFRIALGPKYTALGTHAAAAGSLVVHFAGDQADLVVRALAGAAAEKKARVQIRYACWVPATLHRTGGSLVTAVACALGVGGAQLTTLSRKLIPGERVRIELAGQAHALQARVAWHRPTGAGVELDKDRRTHALVRRMVTELAAGTWGLPSDRA